MGSSPDAIVEYRSHKTFSFTFYISDVLDMMNTSVMPMCTPMIAWKFHHSTRKCQLAAGQSSGSLGKLMILYFRLGTTKKYLRFFCLPTTGKSNAKHLTAGRPNPECVHPLCHFKSHPCYLLDVIFCSPDFRRKGCFLLVSAALPAGRP